MFVCLFACLHHCLLLALALDPSKQSKDKVQLKCSLCINQDGIVKSVMGKEATAAAAAVAAAAAEARKLSKLAKDNRERERERGQIMASLETF